MAREQVKGQLELLILAVLEGGPRHGYAIIAALRERSEGDFDLPEGTVYPALHRMEERGLVSSSWADVGGRRRRMYALTRNGAAALVERRAEWRSFATRIDGVLGWSA